MTGRRIERRRDGSFRLRLPAEERELLRALPAQLRDLLASDDPSLVRLFPPAYPDDREADDEFGALVRGELRRGRIDALRVVERTVDAEQLDEVQLTAWLDALESLRLVLGTQLDVREETYALEPDPSDPAAPALALYGYLSWLQEQTVEALAASLP